MVCYKAKIVTSVSSCRNNNPLDIFVALYRILTGKELYGPHGPGSTKNEARYTQQKYVCCWAVPVFHARAHSA